MPGGSRSAVPNAEMAKMHLILSTSLCIVYGVSVAFTHDAWRVGT